MIKHLDSVNQQFSYEVSDNPINHHVVDCSDDAQDSFGFRTQAEEEAVADPVATPAPGEVASGTEVVLTSATEGASIYFTTDGSIPTTESTLYEAAIEVSGAVTIKAFARKSGMMDSAVVSFAYTIEVVADPVATPGSGEVTFGTEVVLTCETEGALIYYTTDGYTPNADSTLYEAPIEISDDIVISGDFTIKAIAIKEGKTSAVVSFDYSLVDSVATPVATPASDVVTFGTEVVLTCETEGALIYYTTDGLTPNAGSTLYEAPIEITDAFTIKAIAIKEGKTSSILATSYIPVFVVNPVATPAAGAVNENTEVVLTSTTPGALIYYTTDGLTPNAGSTLYEAPIKITGNTTIKAIAIKEGKTSAVVSFLYTII